jgi:hypothetical protein
LLLPALLFAAAAALSRLIPLSSLPAFAITGLSVRRRIKLAQLLRIKARGLYGLTLSGPGPDARFMKGAMNRLGIGCRQR